MSTIPPCFVVLEDIGVDRGRILPRLPLRPVLTKVGGITEEVGTEGLMLEDVLAVLLRERIVMVVVVREDHDVLRLTLTEQEMVDGLQ